MVLGAMVDRGAFFADKSWKYILLLLFLHMFWGCLFETSCKPFDGDVSSVTLVKRDEKTATYSIKYNGWSTVDSLGVFVRFESCKRNSRLINNKWEAVCQTDLHPWGSEKTFPNGRFEGVENVRWSLDHGDTAYVELLMFEKPRGTIGFSQRVIVQKRF